MIKAIIFDCFGVLYVDPGLRFYEKEVKDLAALKDDLLSIDKQYDNGFITEVEHDQAVAELTGLNYDFVHDNIRGDHTLNDELLAYSQSLRPRYKLGMLSNIGKGGMRSFFSDEECDQYFDAVVLSSEVGFTKPSPEIFALTAERLGAAPAECVMIDDRQDNVDGARAAGMQAVWYQSTEQCIGELESILEQSDA